MPAAKKKERSGCPIDFGLDIFGDRWTLLVVRDLLIVGKRHFKELMQSPERIASNILAARLKKLEERGLILREADPDNRKQVVYRLTPMGRDLTPVVIELICWGGKYDPETPVPRSLVKHFARDNDALIEEMRAVMTRAKTQSAKRRR